VVEDASANKQSKIPASVPQSRPTVSIFGVTASGECRGSALPALHVLSVRIAAALVSLNGHVKIRRQPNFVDRIYSLLQTGKE
jgi:hypothetical protein